MRSHEPGMPDDLHAAAVAARGFMPSEEGDALWDAGIAAGRAVPARPFLEIGSYCGKSSIWLGAAARQSDTVLFALDHHRGSEENQPGWDWHEPDLVDPQVGRIDTLPHFRRTVHAPDWKSRSLRWSATHQLSPATGPLRSRCCSSTAVMVPNRLTATTSSGRPSSAPGGTLCIHDVFPDPADGGRPPYEIYCRALESGSFVEARAVGSMRVLQRL